MKEGETVLLTCNVTGVPYPEVTWYRREAETPGAEREGKSSVPRLYGTGGRQKPQRGLRGKVRVQYQGYMVQEKTETPEGGEREGKSSVLR